MFIFLDSDVKKGLVIKAADVFSADMWLLVFWCVMAIYCLIGKLYDYV